MKIIDLLNKIANGEEVPKKIKYLIYEYEFNQVDKEYQRWFNGLSYGLGEDRILDIMLNDEVEILEEEKKIPLKINKIIPSQNYVISDSKNNSVDERLEIIRKRLYANELYMLDIANTLNEIIDYLKSKGE